MLLGLTKREIYLVLIFIIVPIVITISYILNKLHSPPPVIQSAPTKIQDNGPGYNPRIHPGMRIPHRQPAN